MFEKLDTKFLPLLFENQKENAHYAFDAVEPVLSYLTNAYLQ